MGEIHILQGVRERATLEEVVSGQGLDCSEEVSQQTLHEKSQWEGPQERVC